ERRSLTGEAVLERRADAPVEPPQLVPVEPGCRPERIEPRAPERLSNIEFPHPRERAWVEERRLERGAAARETLAEPRGRAEHVARLPPPPRTAHTEPPPR